DRDQLHDWIACQCAARFGPDRDNRRTDIASFWRRFACAADDRCAVAAEHRHLDAQGCLPFTTRTAFHRAAAARKPAPLKPPTPCGHSAPLSNAAFRESKHGPRVATINRAINTRSL